MKRQVFFISDGTGITAEALGASLITQFDNVEFNTMTIPYVDNIKKASETVDMINESYQIEKIKPIVFATLINPEIRKCIESSQCLLYDFFSGYLKELEGVLGVQSSYVVGRSHGVVNYESYKHRIDAVNYALNHDDGIKIKNYGQADIVLVGVSRCGKTPTCLYMALQFGTLAANYPFTDEDLSTLRLPELLRPYKRKLFGLTIDPERLQAIRSERRPNSQYSSLEQCRFEVNEVEAMYRRESIPYLNTTRFSIEEISTKILAKTEIPRRGCTG